jgi:hypothetical protein
MEEGRSRPRREALSASLQSAGTGGVVAAAAPHAH